MAKTRASVSWPDKTSEVAPEGAAGQATAVDSKGHMEQEGTALVAVG